MRFRSGACGKLPIEVLPFALPYCLHRLAELGFPGEVLSEGTKPMLSDNGNCLVDCRIGPLTDPHGVHQKLKSIPGVVETGLFLGMADVVLIQDGDKLETRTRA